MTDTSETGDDRLALSDAIRVWEQTVHSQIVQCIALLEAHAYDPELTPVLRRLKSLAAQLHGCFESRWTF